MQNMKVYVVMGIVLNVPIFALTKISRMNVNFMKAGAGVMPRYIDADKLFRYVDEQTHLSKGKLQNYIRENNTADVAEEKYGEWQRQNGGFFFLCSICGKAAATKGNYCHNCGAKMKGKENEE